MKRFLPPAALLFAAALVRAEGEPRKLIGVAYGTHPRQVLDFYQAKSDRPTPLVFHIHGGGWQGGDKKGFNPKPFLDKGWTVFIVRHGSAPKYTVPEATADMRRTPCRPRARR